jgi:hypothetical protein
MSYINTLTKEQLIRRLIILEQVVIELEQDLAKIGWADEDGNVNTNSVEDAGHDGNIGANICNLFLLSNLNSDEAEKSLQNFAQ